MGVAGLWEVLRPAGQVRSLTELAVEDGFNANPSHQRGFRIGVDASIWFFHATYGREGENPELRTLFFRCCRLLQSPLLPLFVFDGPNRPAIKRGKRIGGNAHWLTQGMKNIIDAFGFKWSVAPGEAEAELAYLNRVGIIDAVLSDDVDNFLFGATMVIRNPNNTLSGNRAHPVKNKQGKDDGNHVVTYTAGAILSNPSVALSRPGTILIGLLSGGDYIPAGLPGCGQKFATGLARAGFGDSLLKAVKELSGARLNAFLDQWRQDIRDELRTNKSGFLPSKKPSLASSLTHDFPSLPVLMSYANPLTSENMPQTGKCKTPNGVWRNDPDPMRIASLCELYFEWGVKDVIVHRFRTVLWPGVVCRAVRRTVMDEDTRRRPTPDEARYPDGGEEGHDSVGSSSPTKRIAASLSVLALSSPSKKPPASGAPASDPSTSETFTLSSLVPLTCPDTLSSSRAASPSSPTLPVSGPPSLLLEVLSQRTHASTDSILEYRVLIDPTTLVKRAESGVRGLRPPLVGGLFGVDPEGDDGSTPDQEADGSGSDDAIERLETAASAASKSGVKKCKARRKNPTTPFRLWLPACMVRAAAPTLAEAYEEKARTRKEKKAKRGAKGQRAGTKTGVHLSSARSKMNDMGDDDGHESVPGPSTFKTAVRSKAKAKAIIIGGGGRWGKPKRVLEGQDDAYEFIDMSAGESPCSSDGEGGKGNTKGKGKAKAKTGKTDAIQPIAKQSVKTSTTNKRATTTNTMKEFFNTTKPSAARGTKSTLSTSRLPIARVSTLSPVASKRVYEEEEEHSAELAIPPLLKSSRPLDLLRAKSRPVTTTRDPITKSTSTTTTVPRYEEEESTSSSSSSRPSGSGFHASSLPCRSVHLVPHARKKSSFVEVSGTDSDIEVSDIRRPLSGTTATIVAYDKAARTADIKDGDMSVSVSAGKILPTIVSRTNVGETAEFAKGNSPRAKSTPSTLVSTASPPSDRPLSAPLGISTIGPTSSASSPSKLAHILLYQPVLEREEEDERSERGELPAFHRGSTESRTRVGATIVRPAPRPFPMQLASESPASPRASMLREKDGTTYGYENDDGEVVEIVDVFTTPRGRSPSRSPTPSPSLPHTLAVPDIFVKPKQLCGPPASPTKPKSQIDTGPHKKTKQRCRVSSDWDTDVSRNEENGILKSPRGSAAHSSPRHVPHARERPSSPTPLGSSGSASRANNAPLWIGKLGGGQPQPEVSGSVHVGYAFRQKTRSSDASAIYISSGSEDEDGSGLSVDNSESSGVVKVHDDQEQDGCTDQDVDGRADMGMILSAPPSPARPVGNLVPTVPAAEVALPNPARVAKFKPATVAISKMDVRAPSGESQASNEIIPACLERPTNQEDGVVPCPARHAPLLIARAKRGKDGGDDIIDLTSD